MFLWVYFCIKVTVVDVVACFVRHVSHVADLYTSWCYVFADIFFVFFFSFIFVNCRSYDVPLHVCRVSKCTIWQREKESHLLVVTVESM